MDVHHETTKGAYQMYRRGTQSYRKTNVMTADPKKLVILCYEGAIDNLKMGKNKIIEKDYEGKCRALTRAQDIIAELLSSLNFEKGGSIANSLDSLYNYMLRTIIHADFENDIPAIDEVVRLLSELKGAWEEIFSRKEHEIESEEAKASQGQVQALGSVSA
ncbi:MAG: flagellar export chaperone FliS [Deltaproteobacteria bacterium]|nr:MAG: flagellar export chaperone FliS [Deltaproteobacteria bacterium]